MWQAYIDAFLLRMREAMGLIASRIWTPQIVHDPAGVAVTAVGSDRLQCIEPGNDFRPVRWRRSQPCVEGAGPFLPVFQLPFSCFSQVRAGFSAYFGVVGRWGERLQLP